MLYYSVVQLLTFIHFFAFYGPKLLLKARNLFHELTESHSYFAN